MDDDGCVVGIVVVLLALFVLHFWLPILLVIGAILLIIFICWLCTRKGAPERKRRREEEARREAEEKKRLRNVYWAQVNSSPWWQWGIPEKVSLVLDVDVLEDFSPEMVIWFKMIVDNAEARDWHIVILEKAYHSIMISYNEKLLERFSRMQNCLGGRLRILHNTGALGEYMMLEKVRPDVFFTKSVKSKIIIHELAQQNGLELAHEVRSPENWKSHFEGAGSSEITEECLSV